MDRTPFVLELGDIIQILSDTNEEYKDKVFFIDYIDNNIIKLIDTNDLSSVDLTINNGKLSDESIKSISLLSKSDKKGYAKQNDLLPNTWVDIYFDGDVPTVITGEITGLEEDMIELKTYPDGDTIYIDFAYKGIPIELPLDKILIREEPEKESN